MANQFYDLTVASARLTFDAEVGNLHRLEFDHAGRTIAPLHTAPWVDEPETQAIEGLAPVEQRLSGDFFCAPFGFNDVEPGPIHGWSANSTWQPVEEAAGTVAFKLERPVMGAIIEKRLRLQLDSPLLYQTHRISGGRNGLTVAHHPMTRMAAGGTMSFSPKTVAMTPAAPLEPKHRFAYPASSPDLANLPATDGGIFNLHRYPTDVGHEDFVTLVEAAGSPLGWTAVLRDAEDDIVFVLKDPRTLPVTMLWFSNGGRDYPPWNGRHLGVLGIEDGCAAGALGHAAALRGNPISDMGAATALHLAPDSEHVIRHVIGAVSRPPGWRSVSNIAITNTGLVLHEPGGKHIALPFDVSFFGAGAD